MTEINPNLPDWIKDHMRRYLETDGADGHIWNGVPTLLLTTRGRRSGDWQMLPLIYGKAGRDYVVVASKGGHPQHPSWYLNLAAEPEVRVQVAAETFEARARTVTGEERDALWQLMVGIFPQYEEYQTATERQIPVVVLEAKPH